MRRRVARGEGERKRLKGEGNQAKPCRAGGVLGWGPAPQGVEVWEGGDPNRTSLGGGENDRLDACAHMHAQLPAQRGRSNKTPTQAAHDPGAS